MTRLLPVWLLLLAACGGNGDECPRPKNVLLLVGDTLRSDRLGCYGYSRKTSPHIDALAARGTLYENAYSQASWTVPSMISMFSGVSVTVEETVLPDFALLAEVLKKDGLETAAFPANENLASGRGFERGFEVFEPSGNVSAQELAQRFASWFAARKDRARPFFAWVQFIDPHEPYAPAPEFDVFSGPGPDDRRLGELWRAESPRVAELSKDVEPLGLEQAIEAMRADSNRYDGEVKALDDGVGRILGTLRAAGALDDTLVILCADHGEMLYEQHVSPGILKATLEKHKGLPRGVQELFTRGHRNWYYEENWNTPLIVAGPGMQARRSQALVPNLDIYPTILHALDIEVPPHLEGQSLWCGEEPDHERVLAHAYLTSAVIERDGKKLVRYDPKWFPLGPDERQKTELFELAGDPHEVKDLSTARPEERDRLEAAILRWHIDSARDANTETTEAMKKALRELGYVE